MTFRLRSCLGPNSMPRPQSNLSTSFFFSRRVRLFTPWDTPCAAGTVPQYFVRGAYFYCPIIRLFRTVSGVCTDGSLPRDSVTYPAVCCTPHPVTLVITPYPVLEVHVHLHLLLPLLLQTAPATATATCSLTTSNSFLPNGATDAEATKRSSACDQPVTGQGPGQNSPKQTQTLQKAGTE